MISRPSNNLRGLIGFLGVALLLATLMVVKADGPAKPAPIKADETDALRLQVSFQQVMAAQSQFENALLRAKVKYKVPLDWNYSFEKGEFEAPAAEQPAQVPPAPRKEKP